MQNPDDYKNFQILGANVQVILDGFGSFTLLASKILLAEGLGNMDDDGIGMAKLDATRWYPLDAFLRAFQRITSEFGEYTLRQAGIHIHKTAKVPPEFLKDIYTAFETMDMGYHLNHGKDNKPMFNPETGEMVDGIGHFRHKPVQGKKQIISELDTPYPCAFDEGIVLGTAQRFDPMAKVTHDPKSCRKKGADRCIYNVTWR